MWQFNDLNIFVAIVEHGSFIAAAKKLDIPSSTVSRRVYQLEQSLGFKLVDRSSRKIELTEQGNILYTQAAPAFRSITEQVEILNESQEDLSGTISITCPVYLGQNIFGQWLIEFSNLYPELKFDIRLKNEYENLVDEKLDIAIRFGPLVDSNLIAQYLFTSRFKLVVSPDYINSDDQFGDILDVTKHPLIMMKQHEGAISYKASDGEAKQLFTNPKILSNDIDLLKNYVFDNQGVGYLPFISVKTDIENGRLVSLFDEIHFGPSRDVFILYRDRENIAKKNRLLINFIKSKSLGLN